MVERLLCKQDAAGSSPAVSTKPPVAPNLPERPFCTSRGDVSFFLLECSSAETIGFGILCSVVRDKKGTVQIRCRQRAGFIVALE